MKIITIIMLIKIIMKNDNGKLTILIMSLFTLIIIPLVALKSIIIIIL